MDFGSTEQTNILDTNNKALKATGLFNSSADIHYGLDISHYQGDLMEEIDPRDSIKFIICKATQGTSYVDNDFRENWREIKTKGFIRGAYHFYVCSEDPIAQADHFSNNIEDIEPTDIPPIIDIEQAGMSDKLNNETMEKDLLLFLKRLENNLKRKPLLYTDYAFAQEYLKNPAFAEYDLWLAEYSKQPAPRIPDIWKNRGFKIWQRSDSYSAYSKSIDLDVYFGSLTKIVQ